jgi:hypothetical protein
MAKTLRSGKDVSEIPVKLEVKKVILKKKHKKHSHHSKSKKSKPKPEKPPKP